MNFDNRDDVCRTCLKVLTKKSEYFNLNSIGLSKTPTEILLDKLRECVPELDFNIIPRATVCRDCAATIDLAYSFKTTCLQTDGLIHSYSKKLGTSNVNLNKLVCYYGDPHVTNSVINKYKKDHLQKINQHAEFIDLTSDTSYDNYEIVNGGAASMSKNNQQIQTSLHQDKSELNSEVIKEDHPPSNSNNKSYKQNAETSTVDITQFNSTEEKNSPNCHEKSFNSFGTEKTEIDYRNDLSFSRVISLRAISPIEFKYNGPTEATNYTNNILPKMENIKQELSNIITSEANNIENEVGNSNSKENTINEINEVNLENPLHNKSLPRESPILLDSNNLSYQHDQTKIITYTCNLCAYSTNSRETFNNHLDEHTRHNSFKCNICGYSTIHLINSDEHNCTAQKSIFECNKCNYKTTYKNVLVKHERTHTKRNTNVQRNKRNIAKEVKCKSCDFSGPQSKLILHIKTHTLEKYKCASCNYKTAKKSLLQTHMKSHFSTITYECDVCSYIALSNAGLNRHKMTHTKPFKCLICKYKTSGNHWLRNHMKKHF